jgi:hypothetical protein
MPESIGWPQLIVLMAFGDGSEDSIRGTVRVRESWQLYDEPAPEGFEVADHPVLGRMAVTEATSRVARRGDLLRRARLDGSELMIRGADTIWMWLDDADLPTALDRSSTGINSCDGGLAERPRPSRWDGDDFTRLTGAIEPIEFLGRAAWSFELAPPQHKPYPLQVVVDAASGLVLREGNADFGSYAEWTSLEVGVDLPDELFVWDGPTAPPVDHEAEHAREMAQRTAWLASRGIGELAITAQLTLVPHVRDDESGAFHASFELNRYGSLVRRPRADEHWGELDQMNWPHQYRWTDKRWDWFIGCDAPLSEAQLSRLRASLAQSI